MMSDCLALDPLIYDAAAGLITTLNILFKPQLGCTNKLARKVCLCLDYVFCSIVLGIVIIFWQKHLKQFFFFMNLKNKKKLDNYFYLKRSEGFRGTYITFFLYLWVSLQRYEMILLFIFLVFMINLWQDQLKAQ